MNNFVSPALLLIVKMVKSSAVTKTDPTSPSIPTPRSLPRAGVPRSSHVK